MTGEGLSQELPLLPLVSKATIESATASLQEDGARYFQAIQARLAAEQPALSEYHHYLLDNAADEIERTATHETFLTVYGLINRQADSDTLNFEYGIADQTSASMPVVSRETIRAAMASRGQLGTKYTLEVFESMCNEQPDLARYCEGYVKTPPYESYPSRFKTFVFLYDVLSRQAKGPQQEATEL